MSRRHAIAVAVAIAAMVAALLPPLWIQNTGDDVVLEVAPVDPLSLFRGNYVDLTYDLDFEVDDTGRDRSWEWNEVVYVVFDDARPANVVRVEESRPGLAPGETCIRGRSRGSGDVVFPSLEQFFVTAEQGGRLETQLSSLVAIVKTTGGCQAILHDLEPE